MLTMMKKASGLLANMVNNKDDEVEDDDDEVDDEDGDDQESDDEADASTSSALTPSFSKEALSAALASLRQSADDAAPLIVQVDPTPDELANEVSSVRWGDFDDALCSNKSASAVARRCRRTRSRCARRSARTPTATTFRTTTTVRRVASAITFMVAEFIETDWDYQQEIAMAIRDALAANAESDSESESVDEDGRSLIRAIAGLFAVVMGACADVIEALLTAVENGDEHVYVDLTGDDYVPRSVSQSTPHVKLEALDECTPTLSYMCETTGAP